FDDFGRNIDPLTGKVRNDRNQNASKYAYTTNGNIIQPFVFTGYQEDEVSGLKFAQARYYSADNGRFQSEDNVKGFVNRPFTLNHYGYCWANPIVLVDNDGNLPKFIKDTEEFGKSIISSANKVKEQIIEKLEDFEGDERPIIVFGISGAFGQDLYLGGGGQMVLDPLKVITDPAHALGFQAVGGTGGIISAGPGEAKATIYLGAYSAESISELEGFGTEVGGSGGEVIVLGGGFWASGEWGSGENGIKDKHRYGGYVSVGANVTPSVAEGHVTMSETSKTFYPVEYIYNMITDIKESIMNSIYRGDGECAG
uniref:RHS repeat-associated core domain-containing protein n=1 Tax=Butyrivibrio sp. AE2005 TaxID=1496722 RepID=UPI00054EDB38